MNLSGNQEAPRLTAAQMARRRRDRRYRGLIYLGTSVWLALSGLTWLKSRLDGLRFVLYWTLCGGAAVLAWVVALRDAVLLRAELRAEAREKNRGESE